jgi:hypothetical protein
MNITYEIAKVAAPALYVLKQNNPACPASLENEEWQEILDKMYNSMSYIIQDAHFDSEELDLDEVEEGCKYFGQYFMHLFC